MKLDHVLYAVDDLDRAAARLEREHGLGSYPGGTHPAFGTGNRIVPLADEAYIELIAVVDPAAAGGNPLGSRVGEIASGGGGWLGWVVRVDDVESRASALHLPLTHGVRMLPSGEQLSWRLAGIERMLADPVYPFFIAWDDMAAHPARVADAAPAVRWIEVAGDEADLAGWLGGIPEWLRIADGDPRGPRAVAVGDALVT